jgi:glycosyltransferase involved in cell wall biosynthesis
MRLSVVLSTYNAPAWLEKVIWGYSVQTHRDFELVIADDGSKLDTARLLAQLADETGLKIRHVWHEDNGFRKCEILNKAILAATSDYLVFSDGDCIPRADFLETHARFAAPGHYLSGGLVRLGLELSQQLERDDIVSQRMARVTWLVRQGQPLSKKLLMVIPGSRGGVVLDRITPTKPTWNGHNASGWKADLVRVNGFDERMGYGGEDCELGERLVNLGLRPKQIRHRAVCFHLDHARGYVDPEAWQWNIDHRAEVRRAGITWTAYGIRKQSGPTLDVLRPNLDTNVQNELKAA